MIAVPAILLVLLAMPSSSNGLLGAEQTKTHYDILGLEPDAKLSDIKKSYRKLALLYHPDRVPPEKKEESTIKFREVSEAYEVLSDESKRAEYDRSLKYGGGSYNNYNNHNMQDHRYQQHRDPFSQFNDLFRNDPFFSEAFKDMDDLFSKTFQNRGNNNRNGNGKGGTKKIARKKKTWGEWLIDKLGIEVNVSSTSTTRNADGTFSTSSYGHTRSHSSPSTTSSSYTSKSTRTMIENGRRITIQSMEKDGNRIEERYEGNNLVQRLVNGRPQNIGRVAGGDL